MDNTTTSSEKESFAVSCNTQLPARGVADMSATASPDSSSSSSANKHMKITPTTNAPTTVSTPPSPRAVTPTPLTPVDLARSTTPVSLSSKTGTANGSVKKKRLHAEGRWTKDEDEKLRQAVQEMGGKNWKKISEMAFSGVRSDVQCLHRWQKVLRPGLHKGPWSKEEDAIVLDFVHKSGGVQCVKWSAVANQVEGRLGKQVRERWYNHLDPMLNKGPWTPEEDALLLQLQAAMGNRWCEIAKNISGRSENAVKNRWNSAQRRARAQKENKKESKQKQKQKKNKSGGGGGDGTTSKKPRKSKKRKATTTPSGEPSGANAKETEVECSSSPSEAGNKKSLKKRKYTTKSSKTKTKTKTKSKTGKRRNMGSSSGSSSGRNGGGGGGGSLSVIADIGTALQMCDMVTATSNSPVQSPTRPATPPTRKNETAAHVLLAQSFVRISKEDDAAAALLSIL